MAKYALHPRLREVYIARLVDELRTISGVLHERFGYLLMDRVVPVPLDHRGVNIAGAPVGYTLDSASPDGTNVAEYSSESSYFASGGKKIKKDFRHATSHHPQVQHLWLLNNTEAGEKISTKLRNSVNRVKKCSGINVEIYDSRRIAEFIVDNLLLDQATPIELGEYLPSLKTFAAEMAATYLVPEPSPNFVARANEMHQLLTLLETETIVVLSGVSGSGKSDLAAALVSEVRKNFHIAAWVDAKEIERIEQLGSFDITGSGATINILGQLSDRCAVVVLDDARASVNLETLRSKCSKSSRVIITTQTARQGAVEIGPLERQEALQVLSSGSSELCPDSILERIRTNVDGNALALSLLNAHKLENFCSWEDLVEISATADALLDDRQVRLATRLLARAQQSIDPELKFLNWCGTQTVDRGLAQFTIGLIGVTNLNRFKLLSPSRPRSLRLHELVFKAVNATVKNDEHARTRWEDLFAEYIGLQAQSRSIEFYSVIYHHRDRIIAELMSGNRRPALQLAYFLFTPPQEIIHELIPVADLVVQEFCSAPTKSESELMVLACIEALEKQFLQMRQQNGAENAVEHLKASIQLYKKFTEMPGLSNRLKSSTQHHYAKALRRIGEIDVARVIFEEVLGGPFPLEASRLQLARIYTELGCKGDALSAIKGILESAVVNANGVAATVLLEAVRLLLHPKLKPEARKLFDDYRRKIADRIVLLASIGFGQAFETFSVVSSSWAYSDPQLFEEIFQSLPPTISYDLMTDETRKAWGEVFLAASSNTQDTSVREKFAQKACQLLVSFKNSPDEFARQRFAKAQLQMGDFAGAADTLERTATEARKEWWHYWRGKAYFGLGQYKEAENAYDVAIAESKDPRSAFFASRAQARDALSDPRCIDDYKNAIAIGVDNPAYEASLREELRASEIKYESP